MSEIEKIKNMIWFRTKETYQADRFAPEARMQIIEACLDYGYTPEETIAIIFSKHLRWYGDSVADRMKGDVWGKIPGNQFRIYLRNNTNTLNKTTVKELL